MSRMSIFLVGAICVGIGALKVWLHVSSGPVLTFESCQGGVLTIAKTNSGAHCWGCYTAALGTALLAIGIWPLRLNLNHAAIKWVSR